MCEKLEVSRSGFYAWLRRAPSAHSLRDRWLQRQIEQHFEESYGVYGSPRIHVLLRRQGERVGRKRVSRLMRELRLKARANRIYKRLPGAVTCRLGIANEARERSVTAPPAPWLQAGQPAHGRLDRCRVEAGRGGTPPAPGPRIPL